MSKLKKIIQNSIIQRVFYAILFLLYNCVILPDTIKYTWSNSSFGVPYFYIWLIPSVILLYQIIFNNMIGWLIFFTLYIALTIYGLIIGFSDIFVNYGIKYSEKAIVLYMIMCIILYLPFSWFLYLIRPSVRRRVLKINDLSSAGASDKSG